MRIRLLICIFLCLSLQGLSQCISSVAISSSYPTICSGNNVVLKAVVTGGATPYTFTWSTGETTASISVNKAGSYTVTVNSSTAGCTPVKQIITLTASSTPAAPTVTKVPPVCPGSSATLTATAPGGSYTWYDSGGAVKQVGGATYKTDPILTSITYYVETTVNGCTSSRTAVPIATIGKPNGVGKIVCAGNSAILSVSQGDSYQWYDAAGNPLVSTQNYTTPPLNVTTTYYVVVVTNGCTSAKTPVTATVAAPPQIPAINANQSVCAGQSINLHADAPAGVINWYNVPVGGVPLISSPDYTTPPLNATTVYYAETSLNGCESGRSEVTVTVNAIPAAPATQTVAICYGTKITLTGGPASASYQWFNAAGGMLSSANQYTTPVLIQSATYYVQESNGNCWSPLTPVNVNVNSQLPLPTVSGAIICPGALATLNASSPGGGTYQWYKNATDSLAFYTGASYTTSALTATTTYYVENTVAGCMSSRVPVTVTVLPALSPPSASGQTVCTGSVASLTASGSANGYAWYDSAAGTSPISTAQVYVTPALTATTTYYLAATSGDCSSLRTPVTVTVNPIPAAPVITGAAATCPGTAATLSATASGSVSWYNVPSGGLPLYTGSIFTTMPLISTSIFYAENQDGGCVSARAAFTVNVISVATPQFEYSSGSYCVSGATTTPVINNLSGGTFSATPAGLVFISASTGEINISASNIGRYIVLFAGNGQCAGTTSAEVDITASFNPAFSYNSSYCQDAANPLPTFPPGGGPGVFSATPAGLVFVNKTSGEINLKASKPGVYQIINTNQANGSCPEVVSAPFDITIYEGVNISAGPAQTVAKGSQVQLAGIVSGATNAGTWSGGTGSFSNPSSLNAIYTPGPNETSATLTLTSADPPGSCGPRSATVTITFTTQTIAPTVPADTVCSGNSATLSAIAPGGTYKWYDSASGTTILHTGPSYTTVPLTANTTYYVETNENGITSARTPVTVAVNTMPVPPIVKSIPACSGGTATLTASGSAGIFRWYDMPVGGTLLSDSASLTTPVLTAPATYYAEAIKGTCSSERVRVDVAISPVPQITSLSSGAVCSSTAFNYNITADHQGVTFQWSRAAVTGISNAVVNNITSPTINETLINTTGNAINVIYTIIPTLGNCSGQPFNYTVTVNPTPVVMGHTRDTICDYTTDNYAINFNTSNTSFTWSRAAVTGISNLPVSGQAAGTIREVLFNTTNLPVNVTYVINYSTSSCQGTPFNLIITVNPQAVVTSALSTQACSGSPEDYQITSNIPGATYSWSRDVVDNITNPAVSNQTSPVINETLISTSQNPVGVKYVIIPITNGCPGTPYDYFAVVNPPVPVVVANANSPVCQASTIHLSTTPVTGAAYLWTGPNGFSSTDQNPVIANVTAANAGTYTLVLTIKGCSTIPATVDVNVDKPPLAKAGPDISHVCVTNTSIPLAGSITGGTTTGIWSTSGTGTFSPSADFTSATAYIPSAADKTAGSVTITLSSTSKDDCTISTSSFTITFGPSPGVDAGPDQGVCSQTNAVTLNGTILISGGGRWSTLGTGTFSPSAAQVNDILNTYIPSAQDIANGFVNLVLTANSPGLCDISRDTVRIAFIGPPTVNAGGTRYVLQGNQITLTPTVSDNNVTYLWSPNVDINDVTVKDPVITGGVDLYYTLTVTDSRGCVSSDSAFIKVSPKLSIDNAFTPNSDGINDYWVIKGISAYTQATVDIFNRYGQKLFHSLGYGVPWDGTFNNQPLPFGTYYYIIDTKYQGIVLSGYVTIIR